MTREQGRLFPGAGQPVCPRCGGVGMVRGEGRLVCPFCRYAKTVGPTPAKARQVRKARRRKR